MRSETCAAEAGDARRAIELAKLDPTWQPLKPKGDRAGQHAIHINDPWRICFVWKADGAHEVVVDYH
jgi:plasmid maintenance system killer protein